MKKIITISVAIILAFSLCACGESDSKSSAEKYSGSKYLGTWELTGYLADGQEFPLGEHDATKLTLNADGTFTDISEAAVGENGSEWQEVTTEGTWEETENGFTTTDDIFTMEYTVDGDKATADYESTTLIRKKVK